MQAFLLTGQRSRQAACDVIMQAPAYSTATIKPQKRSDEQNAKLWAMLSDISRAKPQGRVHSVGQTRRQRPKRYHYC